jgi:hypothetical protein
MKKYFLIIIVVIFSKDIFAQKHANTKSLAINFCDALLEQNINVIYRHEVWHDWSLYGGIKYHINSQSFYGDVVPLIYVTPDEHAFFSKVEATDFKEHIGLKLGIEKSYVIPGTHTELCGFYDFMYTYAGISTVGGGIDAKGNAVLYTPWPNLYTSSDIGGGLFEHHFGAAIRMQAYKKLYISVNGGLGMYKYSNGVVFNNVEIFSSSLTFSRMYGFGVEYRLGKAKPPARTR